MIEVKAGNSVFTQCMTMRTNDAPRLPAVTGGSRAASGLKRRTRLRAVLLTTVWLLPGVWCAAHAIAHEIESDQHELHLTVSASTGIPAMSCGHEHVHAHPEAPLVLSTEGAKKLDASMLLTAALEAEGSKATLRAHEDVARWHAARRDAAVAGPRAPPIS